MGANWNSFVQDHFSLNKQGLSSDQAVKIFTVAHLITKMTFDSRVKDEQTR